jgi:transketolase
VELSYVAPETFQRLLGRGLPAERECAIFATCCRINTLYMIARAGSGHIGSSFSSLDIVSWLHLREMRGARGGPPQDLFFSSKGHDVPGLYAVLIGLGRLPFEQLHLLRRLGGLPGHPDVGTTGMVTNTGPLGMGISKAKGMVRAHRLRGEDARVYVMTGDGELQEGQIWESLAGAVHQYASEITVIVDHNKIQSDTWVSRVSDLGNLVAKFEAFGWHAERLNGHDLAVLGDAFERLRTVTDRPKVIIADTIKGRGVSFMEPTALGNQAVYYRFHSGAPDDDSYRKGLAQLVETANGLLREAGEPPLALATSRRPPRPALDGVQRLIPAYTKALMDHAERNPRVVALDADLVLDTGLIPFADRFPDRFIECGIAEQDMVSQAGGLALRGLLPVVHSFACFLSTRPNEQIYNNATEGRRIVYVGSLAGLLPGGPGHSHQAVRDIAALGGIPGLEMLEPSCEEETTLAVAYALERAAGSCYLRLASIPCRVPYRLPRGYRLEPGRGVAITEGDDATLVGYGPVLLPQAVGAAALLAGRGVAVRVVNLPWLNQVDDDWLRDLLDGVGDLWTLDDHYLAGGQGEMLAARVAELALPVRVHRFGVRGIPACGQNDEVLRAHGLDAESLAAGIAERIGGGVRR